MGEFEHRSLLGGIIVEEPHCVRCHEMVGADLIILGFFSRLHIALVSYEFDICCVCVSVRPCAS